MTTAFQRSAFQQSGFQIDALLDTHDGFDTEEEPRRKREAKERLREQIRFAVEGPLAVELEAVAAPQLADALYVPLEERIDYEALARNVTLIAKLQLAEREAAIDADDEEILGL